MASAVGELGAILRGGEPGTQQEAADGGAAAAAAAAAAAGQPGVDISKLSQLSDFANKELQKDGTQPGAPGLPPGGVQFSQESLLSAPDNPLAFQAPSQPDIPAPSLPPSQAMSQQLPGDGAQPPADDPQKAMAAAVAAATMPAMNFDPQQLMQSMALMPTLMGNMDWSHLAVPHMGEAETETQPGPRSKTGKPTRRGPMDEMRQLVRILVKLIPQSIAHIGANEEAGGGNRISEEQIKNYLDKTLGDAPRPNWGVPNGWFSYVSELFTWALGRPVDEDSCKKCAKREPGRSWEALDGELAAIGVHPHCWPLPLTLLSVREAEKNPIAQPIPQMPAVKRGSGGDGGESVSRARRGGPTVDLDRLTEYELWKHLLDVLNACTNRNNTSPGDVVQQVANLKSQAKNQMDALAGGLNMLQYVPVMGLDGNPSMMAFLGGMQGMPMGLPQVAGMQMQMGPDGQLMADGAAVAAAAQAAMAVADPAAAAALAAAAGGEEPSAKRQRRDDGTEEGGEDDGAPMSASDARGTLFGALGGGDATKEAAGATSVNPPLAAMAQQQHEAAAAAAAAQQLGQLPLLYTTQPGFVMPPGMAEGTPAETKHEGA